MQLPYFVNAFIIPRDMYIILHINEIHIELYTDCKDLSAEQHIESTQILLSRIAL